MNKQSPLVFLVIIAGRQLKEEILETISQIGGKLIHTMYGKSSVRCNLISDMLGFAVEEHKIVITCLIQSDKTASIFTQLDSQFRFNEPNTGIAFTIPVDGLSF